MNRKALINEAFSLDRVCLCSVVKRIGNRLGRGISRGLRAASGYYGYVCHVELEDEMMYFFYYE